VLEQTGRPPVVSATSILIHFPDRITSFHASGISIFVARPSKLDSGIPENLIKESTLFVYWRVAVGVGVIRSRRTSVFLPHIPASIICSILDLCQSTSPLVWASVCPSFLLPL